MYSEKIITETDRWSFRPALLSLVSVAALELICQLPGTLSFFMIPISLLAYAIAILAVIATTVFLLIKKRPRRGASVFLILLLPVLLWLPINQATDLVHLWLTVRFGAGQLGNSSVPSGDDFAVYDWSVGLAGGSNTFLIHDVTDEIALSMAQHTQPSDSENGWGEECAGKVRRLVRHYYICTF